MITTSTPAPEEEETEGPEEFDYIEGHATIPVDYYVEVDVTTTTKKPGPRAKKLKKIRRYEKLSWKKKVSKGKKGGKKPKAGETKAGNATSVVLITPGSGLTTNNTGGVGRSFVAGPVQLSGVTTSAPLIVSIISTSGPAAISGSSASGSVVSGSNDTATANAPLWTHVDDMPQVPIGSSGLNPTVYEPGKGNANPGVVLDDGPPSAPPSENAKVAPAKVRIPGGKGGKKKLDFIDHAKYCFARNLNLCNMITD